MFQKTIFIIPLLCVLPAVPSVQAAEEGPEIVINEVLTNPLEAGRYSFEYKGDFYIADWVELYNPGDEDIDLTNYYLTDACNEPDKWNISCIGEDCATSLIAGTHYSLWCPGDCFLDRDINNECVPIPEYLAPFRLSSTGEWIGLYKKSGNGFELVDGFLIPELPKETSYGCFPDGDHTQRGYLESPTQQAENKPFSNLPPEIRIRSYRGVRKISEEEIHYTMLIEADQVVRVRADITDIDWRESHPGAPGNNIDKADLFYSLDGENFSRLPMRLSNDPRDAASGLYEAFIPGQPEGSVVFFYISATDRDGGESELYWSTLYNPEAASPVGFRYPVGNVGTSESAIRLNELLAVNTDCPPSHQTPDPTIDCNAGGEDSRDNRDDWVELLNTSSDPQELTNLYITNNELDPKRFSLMHTIGRSGNVEGVQLKANSHLFIWCDNETNENVSTSETENSEIINGETHAPFTLSGREDELFLIEFKDSDEDRIPETFIIIDSISWGPGEKRNNPEKPWLGPQDGNWSLGRFPEGAEDSPWGRMKPTPGPAAKNHPGGSNSGFTPYLDFKGWSPASPSVDDTITFYAEAWDNDAFTVKLIYSPAGGETQEKAMADDGTNGDATAADGIFTCRINQEGNLNGLYNFWIIAKDSQDNQARFPTSDALTARIYIGASPAGTAHPVITEVLAANRRCDCRITCSCIEGEESPPDCELGGLDPFNNADDWVELYNPGDETIFLDKYYLSDRHDWLTRWAFPPNTTLSAGKRLIVWCDGESLTEGPLSDSLHTTFLLDAEGDEVYLTHEKTQNELQIVDAIQFTGQLDDVSYGRTGQQEEGMLLAPTPGEPNEQPAARAHSITERQPFSAGDQIHINVTALQKTEKIIIVSPLLYTDSGEIIYEEKDTGTEPAWDWMNGEEIEATNWSAEETEITLTLPAGLAKGPYLLCVLSGYNVTWHDGGVPFSSLPVEIGDSTAQPLFIRGNANQDATINLADAIATLSYLFSGGDLNCLDAGDANDDGSVNLADAVYLLSYQFAEGDEPAAPFPECGTDPSEDTLQKCIYEGCGEQ